MSDNITLDPSIDDILAGYEARIAVLTTEVVVGEARLKASERFLNHLLSEASENNEEEAS